LVTRSLRIPLSLDERARERGVGATTLMRQILEAGVAELDSTAAVSLADVQRRSHYWHVRPVPHDQNRKTLIPRRLRRRGISARDSG
jgi:hypothetical protein